MAVRGFIMNFLQLSKIVHFVIGNTVVIKSYTFPCQYFAKICLHIQASRKKSLIMLLWTKDFKIHSEMNYSQLEILSRATTNLENRPVKN